MHSAAVSATNAATLRVEIGAECLWSYVPSLCMDLGLVRYVGLLRGRGVIKFSSVSADSSDEKKRWLFLFRNFFMGMMNEH